MSRISDVDSTSLAPLLDEVQEQMQGCSTLEQAAQRVTHVLYEAFTESVVLARVYATVPFGQLPETNRTFVTNLAASNEIAPLVGIDTLILSLLGTRGLQPEWNDRRKSEGHAGIPLASAAFVEKIPMVSRLLKEVGLDLDWIDNRDTDAISKILGGVSGIFYVQDAAQATDNQGRKIIPAQDFVEANDVKTVFGLAGGYAASTTFVTIIVFCRETLDKPQAELFSPLINAFITNTIFLASAGAVFD
jgi:hypothetical protein